jgi:hypothetical protein
MTGFKGAIGFANIFSKSNIVYHIVFYLSSCIEYGGLLGNNKCENMPMTFKLRSEGRGKTVAKK